jgi:membrane protein
MLRMQSIWQLVRQAASDWVEDKAPQLGAALAYYAMFSLAPLLVIVLSVSGMIFGEDAATGALGGQLRDLLGEAGAEGVEDMIQAANKPSRGAIATVLGVIVLLFGASGVFGQLQDALNTIWEVEPKAGRGIWGMVNDRVFSFAMVLGTGFLLLVSLALSAWLASAGKWMQSHLPGPELLLQALNLIVSYFVITGLFAMIFKLVPDVKIAWRDVWFGALVTAALFTIGKIALGLYLGKSGAMSSYGAAGSFIVILLWVYYSSQILFFGAELTQAFAELNGSRVTPAAGAISTADTGSKQN